MGGGRFIENPRRGSGGSPSRGGGGEGAGRVSAGNWGRGLNIFFGAEMPAKKLSGPILRDTAILSLQYPISRDTFQGRSALTQNCAIPL